ncbi:MAG: radical SAM protein [Archaeoglobaceae archaeon]
MEAKLYRKLRDRVLCMLCWRFCRLRDGEEGFCRVRYAKGGKLFTRSYGRLSYLESRPIEIKPFYHFKPGSTSMTFSGFSCNLDCPWCQNWSISKRVSDGFSATPQQVVEAALRAGDASTCASLNEPTLLFEFLLDVFSLAKRFDLLNTMVSNGYMSVLALRKLREAGLDAINVDVKGDEFAYSLIGGKHELVWKTIREADRMGIHVEVVCLLVTGVSDSEEVVEENVRRLAEINPEIPIHFTRYFPAYRFTAPPTEIGKLERAVEIAKRELSYAYIGNVPGHRYENTFCPDCGELLVRRYHVRVFENRVSDGCCPRCGRRIYGVW